MIIPPYISDPDDFDQRGSIFNTPILTKGKTWLPITQVVFMIISTISLKKKHPSRPWYKQIFAGFLGMVAMLGSEWGHNLAHTFASNQIGHPPDAIKVNFGMPLLHYEKTNDESITPRQHIIRALGGPFFNTILVPVAWGLKQISTAGTIIHDIATTLLGTNLFLGLVSLLPIPGIDGGPILKWSMVEKSKSIEEADEIVRKANWGVSAACVAGSTVAFKKKKPVWGFLIANMAVLSFLIASGILKEHD